MIEQESEEEEEKLWLWSVECGVWSVESHQWVGDGWWIRNRSRRAHTAATQHQPAGYPVAARVATSANVSDGDI